MQSADMVNHPPHYTFAGPEYETSRVIKAWGLDFHRGNAVKYISRAGKKEGSLAKEIEDIEKAVWYLQDDLSYLREKAQKEQDRATLQQYPFHLRDAVHEAMEVIGAGEESLESIDDFFDQMDGHY